MDAQAQALLKITPSTPLNGASVSLLLTPLLLLRVLSPSPLVLSPFLLIVNESNAIKKDDRDQRSREEWRQWCSFLFFPFTSQDILSTSASSVVHLLRFALSCCAVLLKLPRWPRYLQRWSAQEVRFFFFSPKKPFWGCRQVRSNTHSALRHVFKTFEGSVAQLITFMRCQTHMNYEFVSHFFQSPQHCKSALMRNRAHMRVTSVFTFQCFSLFSWKRFLKNISTFADSCCTQRIILCIGNYALRGIWLPARRLSSCSHGNLIWTDLQNRKDSNLSRSDLKHVCRWFNSATQYNHTDWISSCCWSLFFPPLISPQTIQPTSLCNKKNEKQNTKTKLFRYFQVFISWRFHKEGTFLHCY